MGPIVSEQYEFVIGVDTHAATHTFALVAGGTGAVLDRVVFPATSFGLCQARGWLARRAGGAPALVVVEGTGSFGAILAERLQAAGHEVVEAAKMPAGERRGTGKSDDLDAVRIARAVLGLTAGELRTPRALSTDRARVAMRVLVVAREQMTGERTRAVNALTALVRTIDLGRARTRVPGKSRDLLDGHAVCGQQ
jgi:transposase